MTASRPIRAFAAAVLFVVVTGGCRMTVDLRTIVHADGGGVFRVDVSMDKEMVDALGSLPVQEGESRDGISLLTSFFDCLKGRGWTVERTQPGQGMQLIAEKPFADPKAFDEVLESLQCAPEGEQELRIENLFNVKLDYTVQSSLLRSTTDFKGSVDLGSHLSLTEETKGQLQTIEDLDVVKVQLSAELPGATSITQGDGIIRDGVAIWQPKLAQKLVFEGRSSTLRVTGLLLLGVPLLLVLGAGAWWLAGRRKPQEGSIPVFTQAENVTPPGNSGSGDQSATVRVFDASRPASMPEAADNGSGAADEPVTSPTPSVTADDDAAPPNGNGTALSSDTVSPPVERA